MTNPILTTATPVAKLTTPVNESKSNNFPIAASALNVGFGVGLLLAFLCLIGAGMYLYIYLLGAEHDVTNIMKTGDTDAVKIMGIHARNIQARLSLQACGIFVGLAFGFLGFSLFLIGIKGEMEIDGTYQGWTIKGTRLLPGIVVIVASTILVGVSVTHTTSYTFTTPYLSTDPNKPPSGIPDTTPQAHKTSGKGV